ATTKPGRTLRLFRSTGVSVASRTPILICNSKDMASGSLSPGLIAHTCVESTVRFAVELGYDVTVVKDATADYSEQFMHAALVTNLPDYASGIVTALEVANAF